MINSSHYLRPFSQQVGTQVFLGGGGFFIVLFFFLCLSILFFFPLFLFSVFLFFLSFCNYYTFSENINNTNRKSTKLCITVTFPDLSVNRLVRVLGNCFGWVGWFWGFFVSKHRVYILFDFLLFKE